MFRKDKSLTMKSSASALSNNLSVHVDTTRSSVHYVVVHKFLANLVSSSLDGQAVNHRQIVGKEPTTTYGTVVIQARLVSTPSRLLLVLALQSGFQIFDVESAQMLYWYALEDSEKSECFGRGICGFQQDTICVGTSEGEILLFDIPARGSNITVTEHLKGHTCAIWDLQSDRDRLISSDDSGSIAIWTPREQGLKQIILINGYSYPCTSLAIWNELIVGGYGSGHLRVFTIAKGNLLAEVTAHAKWINAVDVAKSTGLLLSAGEDSFVRIWQLSGHSPQIEHRHNECVSNLQLHGAKFVSADGKAFGCTGYDSNEILFYMAV